MNQTRTKPSFRNATPLWVISLFITLTEVMTGIAATQTEGTIQALLTGFVMLFPIFIASVFFLFLWYKPQALYPPTEFREVDIDKFSDAMQRQRTVEKAALNALPDAIYATASEFENKPDQLLNALREQVQKAIEFQEPQTPQTEIPRSHSILWVDDNPMNNVYESKVLKRLGANRVTARSTKEALAFINSHDYDLIISDVHRIEDGKGNSNAGYELLDKISEIQHKCPVIFYTGSVSRLNKKRSARAFGAADIPNKLVNLVIATLENSPVS